MYLFGKIGITGRAACAIFALLLLLSISACHSSESRGISAPETVPSENEQVDESRWQHSDMESRFLG